MNKVFNIGLIGCGHISETYFRGHEYFNNFKIIKCADLNKEASSKCAQDYNIIASSVDELLNDPEIEIILNLTIPKAHYEVAKILKSVLGDRPSKELKIIDYGCTIRAYF